MSRRKSGQARSKNETQPHTVPESSEVGGAGECTDFGRWANGDQMGNESGDKDGGAHEELPGFYISRRMEKWRRTHLDDGFHIEAGTRVVRLVNPEVKRYYHAYRSVATTKSLSGNAGVWEHGHKVPGDS